MKDIERRIEKVEAKLRVGQRSEPRPLVLAMVQLGGEYLTLPEPLEEWITYHEQIAERRPIILLKADEEVVARLKAGRADLDIFGTWKSIHDETK